ASLVDYIESGEIINSEINTRLLENIFFKNSPLHDGAVIITNNKIVSAGAILPVSRDQSIPRNLGLRHRAAMGITEKTDALTIIVSEESGAISVAMNGKINLNLKAEELQQILVEEIQF
ncbi:MAG TPA: DNA integrity scanning protein DisA nucleotide-binding domain protein, partial [Paludibacteraceae bacterium]|nr:DNA integrity scanning protein DisA nucleotide-binding domain protein [Paludibacteraceae bacterium]